MKKALIILAQTGYQDVEYTGTRKSMEAAGITVTVASKEAGECTGKLGGTETAAIALRDVHVNEYDYIAYIGGPGAEVFISDADALRIANDAVRANKPLGAICIAPLILAKAHVLDGKIATVWDRNGEQEAILERYGATYTGDTVTVDGLIVTGNGPEAAEEFGRALAAL